MGKVTDTAVTPPRPTAHTTAPKIPTSEQLRMAQLLVDPKSEDHSSLRDKVHKVMELTRCDENSAFIALHDCDNDVELAVVNLLEGDQQQDAWIVQEGKKPKKVQQNQPNAEDNGPTSDEPDIIDGKTSNRRQRGGGSRGGGAIGGSADGPPRLRGRNGGAWTTRGGGAINKENDVFGDFGGGERGGISRGRGRGARENNDRGGRGRGFGPRGGRRGGGGFHQSDSDGGNGGGGFAQIDSWNAPPPDNNTWDNSMANVVSNGPAGEWGKRKNANESNTWDNSMAANKNVDYDWGGEEDWSKLRDGMVIEPSSASKGSEKPLPSTAPSTGLAQTVSPAPAPIQADASRVRGESIDVNSLFGSNQQPVTQQQSASSSTIWASSKQATADLKNELGIGKMAPPGLGESTSHTHNRDSAPPKLNEAKVELPSMRAAAPIGPIDVQFGDMTLGLGADTSHGLFDFTAPTSYQQQNTTAQTKPKDQGTRPQQQHSVYQRAAGGDHVNGPDLLSSNRTTDKDTTTYPGAGSFSTQPSEHSMSQQQKILQQQAPQQQFASNRVHPNATQAASSLPQRTVNSGTAERGEHQRSQLLSSSSTGPTTMQQQSMGNDYVGVPQYSRDENLVQMMNMGTMSNAMTVPAMSKTQVSAGTAINQQMAPYQQAMAGIFPYMALDQASLNYLQTQNYLYNTGGYDIRTVNSLGGANMGMGRDTGDMKSHMMRQENGSVLAQGSTGPPTAGAGNLNMPPPGLPGPTVSNAEAAALAAAQMLYPHFQSVVNYPPSGSPYLAQPQFYVPNVSSASAPTGGNQYQRGGYQPAPQLFGGTGYEELQQMTSQADYGKTSYAMPPPSSGKSMNSGSGSGMALGANDGNKYGGGMKGPYDSKQFAPATATPPPQLANMSYTQTATAPTHYGYSGYVQPVMNMNMMPPNMPSNAQMPNDLLNQRGVNQNGKPQGGPSGVGKGNQPYQYWGN